MYTSARKVNARFLELSNVHINYQVAKQPLSSPGKLCGNYVHWSFCDPAEGGASYFFQWLILTAKALFLLNSNISIKDQ